MDFFLLDVHTRVSTCSSLVARQNKLFRHVFVSNVRFLQLTGPMLEKLPEYMTRGLGPWIQTVTRPVLREFGEHVQPTGIRDVEVLSSYNWVDPDHPPTIMVPGGPRVLRSGLGPVQLGKTKDDREFYPTTTRLPLGAPTQPMFQAIQVLRPECRFNNVDVITSRNVILLLLNFCRYSRPNFRLNATVIHDSLVLEHHPVSKTAAEFDHNYGFDFEEAMAAYPEGLEHSESHWRILRYNMGPLTWVVHYESDGTTEPYGRCDNQAPAVIPARDYESATVVVQGHLTPQEQTLEMKSKGNLHKWIPNQQYLKCWAGCTGYLLLGQLHNGLVQEVKLGDRRLENNLWIRRSVINQQALEALPRLILALKRAVRKAPSGQAGLIFRAHPWSRVEVFDADEQVPIVSQEMREKFWVKRRKRAKGGGNTK